MIECDFDLDWQESEQLLKFRVPTHHQGAHARFGAPFGSVLRPQKPGDPRAEAMWEVPGSRWAVVQDDAGHEGLFMVTEAKYGFACRDGVLDVSLVRSPLHTGSPDDEFTWIYPAAAREGAPAPRCTDQGQQLVRVALGRYTANLPRESQPAALADTLYTPPRPMRAAPSPPACWGWRVAIP